MGPLYISCLQVRSSSCFNCWVFFLFCPKGPQTSRGLFQKALLSLSWYACCVLDLSVSENPPFFFFLFYRPRCNRYTSRYRSPFTAATGRSALCLCLCFVKTVSYRWKSCCVAGCQRLSFRGKTVCDIEQPGRLFSSLQFSGRMTHSAPNSSTHLWNKPITVIVLLLKLTGHTNHLRTSILHWSYQNWSRLPDAGPPV